MAEYEPLQGVATISFPVQDVEDLLLETFTLAEAGGPVISSATSMF